MTFQIGHTINVGSKKSIETRLKISVAHRGKVLSEGHKRKMSLAKKGKTSSVLGKRWRIKDTSKMKGRRPWNYKGVLRKVNPLRAGQKYKHFREAVLERDNHACTKCFRSDVVLELDHIKPVSVFPELAYSMENARMLCKKCHQETDTYGGRAVRLMKSMYERADVVWRSI